MEFELQQVICDTFDPYVLINPLPIICVRLVLIVCTFVPARWLGRKMSWFRLMLAHLGFTGSLLTR